MKFTLVSAAKFEVDAILNSDFASRVDDYIEIGVGALESMYRVAENASRFPNRDVLFIGSAGILGRFNEPSLALISEVSWFPTGDRLGLSYPVPKYERIPLNPATQFSAALPHFNCICGPSVSIDAGAAAGSAALENIELFGVALKTSSKVRSFSAILGISNAVGPNSHEQWRSNWRTCAELTSTFLNKQLD